MFDWRGRVSSLDHCDKDREVVKIQTSECRSLDIMKTWS